MMALKIWKIALLVEDVAEAEKLYVEVLGMPVIERLSLAAMGIDGEAVFLDAGGVQLELIPQAAFNGAPERLQKCGVHHLSFQVDHVETVQEELKSKGANYFLEAFNPVEGMTLAFFDGTNGVNLQLFNWKR
jgi:catechol 2,3-dioxygenase-like lactoylglutathione lyase family enzyme